MDELAERGREQKKNKIIKAKKDPKNPNHPPTLRPEKNPPTLKD
jgi:hypothetical protein